MTETYILSSSQRSPPESSVVDRRMDFLVMGKE